MSERTEAAARERRTAAAYAIRDSLATRNAWDMADAALEAADLVMFSDAAVERAAEALYDVRRGDPSARLVTKRWADLDPEMKPFYRTDARAVIESLRG